jgi:hypothetical protein
MTQKSLGEGYWRSLRLCRTRAGGMRGGIRWQPFWRWRRRQCFRGHAACTPSASGVDCNLQLCCVTWGSLVQRGIHGEELPGVRLVAAYWDEAGLVLAQKGGPDRHADG